MTVTEVTAKRGDSADEPDAVRLPEPGSREPAGRPPRIVPFLITLAVVALNWAARLGDVGRLHGLTVDP
jgi:hypothetical protein